MNPCIWNCLTDDMFTMLQDFVRHFHVLLPRGTSATKSGIREFFRRIHLPPAGYQVGNTMVRILETSSHLVYHLICGSSVLNYMFLCDAGVPAGGGASASSDSPPPGSAAANCHAAAPLQGRPGEEALCRYEESRRCHPGEMWEGLSLRGFIFYVTFHAVKTIFEILISHKTSAVSAWINLTILHSKVSIVH